MSSPQRRRELPQEIRDKILSYLLVDEVVKVRTVKTRVYLTTEEIEARIRARRHPDSMQDSLRHLNCYKMRIHRELSQVDLVYSDSLWILMGEGLRKDEIQDLVYKNATRDLTRINLRRVLNCQEILKPLLHKFRKIQLSLNFPNEKLGRVFDQIEHLTIKGSIWESYRNVMGSKTRTREDDLSVIPARAIKGLFSLTKGAAVEPVKVLRGCKPDDLGSLPMRILPDEGKDKDAAAHGKKHGMCGLE